MGIPGILKEIGKGERTALSKLAIDHLERHNRPLRIAIDAAIWNFQTQSGQGGKNPALRTLFFRLLRLLALPIQPVFVYDGKNKPLTKRGRTVSRYTNTCVPNELSKVLVRKFCYPWHVAPGEAEAECALLQKKGVVDMVMSQDVDAIMFGAGITLRDWSKEGTRGNKAPTHVNVMDSIKLKQMSGLDPDGMILVALLSGGDYDEAALPGFGCTLACEIARAGFGKDLIEAVNKQDWSSLQEWRERLQYELETNESGYFKRRHKALTIPATFPDLKILQYYTNPAVSKETDLPNFEAEWSCVWDSEIDVTAMRDYVSDTFDWCWKSGARRLVRCFAQPLFQDRLRRGTINPTVFAINSISERRQHFINDGISELRLSVVPADVVGIDIDAEEDNPDYVAEEVNDAEDALITADVPAVAEEVENSSVLSVSPSKRRKAPYWDPYVAEKWWIPETLLQLGLPAIVEGWHQLQRDIHADPKKFATRKAGKATKVGKSIDAGMKPGAIHGFFSYTQKSTMPKAIVEAEVFGSKLTSAGNILDSLDDSTPTDDRERDILVGQICPSTPPPAKKPPSRDNNNQCLRSDSNDRYLKSSALEPLMGSSFSEAITIESSPSTTVVSSWDEIRLSQITQRRTRGRKGHFGQVPSSPHGSPSRTQRPIETFFTQTKQSAQDSVVKTTTLPTAAPNDFVLPSEPSTGLSGGLKSAASARESLPGTWRSNGDTALHRRAPRVSYVDLTND